MIDQFTISFHLVMDVEEVVDMEWVVAGVGPHRSSSSSSNSSSRRPGRHHRASTRTLPVLLCQDNIGERRVKFLLLLVHKNSKANNTFY